MGVWRSGAFVDLDEEPCGLWSRLARYGACNCRSGVPPPDSAAGMVPPYWAARCAAGEFAGGHEPPGNRPARRRGADVATSPTGCRKGRQWTSFLAPPDPAAPGAANRQHLGMGGRFFEDACWRPLPPCWAARFWRPIGRRQCPGDLCATSCRGTAQPRSWDGI